LRLSGGLVLKLGVRGTHVQDLIGVMPEEDDLIVYLWSIVVTE
ncbi:hypothetical protein AVEN_139309-1, partial [Araneus ventricosus]